MTFREAYLIAGRNAAGLIEAMDLDQLYGGDATVEGNEELFERAQRKLVNFLSSKFAGVVPPKGDPDRIPNKVKTGFNAGWQAAKADTPVERPKLEYKLPKVDSMSITVNQSHPAMLDDDGPEPDKCQWCGGYHRGGCHKEPSRKVEAERPAEDWNPELRDVKVEWVDLGGTAPHLHIAQTHGNGKVTELWLTNLQAREIAKHAPLPPKSEEPK